MEKFKATLLKEKLVSVWGVGYLGFTEIVGLQSKGFRVNVFDITGTDFEKRVKKNEYPSMEQRFSWSRTGNIPPLDVSKINIVKKPELMSTANVHILSFPLSDKQGNDLLKKVYSVFDGLKKRFADSLVIFQSVGTPGQIDTNFTRPLKKSGVALSTAAAFRSDWSVEEFIMDSKKRVLAANDTDSLKKVMFFYDTLGIRYNKFSTIKEAEIYENTKNSFQYATDVFINQLALAYADTDIRAITKCLLEDIELSESHLSIGAGGYKMPFSVQNILDGSRNPNALSLIKDVQSANLSMILNYAELLKKKGFKSATILGLTEKGNQKNLDLSPSVILAEYLNKLGITVYIDDPFYDDESLHELLPFSKSIDILKDKLRSEALFIMTDHNKYKYITQQDINSQKISNAGLIIDNVSLFKNYKFSHSTVYHAIGDGRLGTL